MDVNENSATVADGRTLTQDWVGLVTADVDPDVLTFLRTKANSFAKLDLIRFFSQNPYTTDTAKNIARYAGRSVEVVQSELADLASQGVLNTDRLGELVVYSLAGDPEIRDMLGRFVAACEDRQFRVRAIYHIIRAVD